MRHNPINLMVKKFLLILPKITVSNEINDY